MPDARLVLQGATLIDGGGATPVRDAMIVVNGGVIERIGGPGMESPPEARVLRLDGKFVLPGLIDSHLHLGTSGGGLADPDEFKPATLAASLRTLLGFGVTTVMDMAAQPRLAAIQGDIESRKLLGPRLYGVRYGVTAPNSHPMGLVRELGAEKAIGSHFIEVDSVAAARQAVERIAAEAPDGLKIYHSRTEFPGTMCLDCNRDKLRPEVLAALVEAAKARGLRVFAHIAWPSEAREVIEAGVDVLTHPVTHAETTVDDVCRLMVEKDVVMHTTLTRIEAYFGLRVDPFMRERLAGRVSPVVLRSLGLRHSKTVARHEASGVTADARRILEITLANVRRANKAGVKIAMGTDSGGPGAIHGVCVPREMELMNEAGMTPMEVIVAATKNAATVIGQGERLGSIEAGKLADILVIEGDPLRDISNIRRVAHVIKNGVVIDSAELRIEAPAPPAAQDDGVGLPTHPTLRAW